MSDLIEGSLGKDVAYDLALVDGKLVLTLSVDAKEMAEELVAMLVAKIPALAKLQDLLGLKASASVSAAV